uniref:Uncharacterized protein n=1 Tax=Rhizophora mucronata TaxID=61149 RepID=A0A2P2Q557_RHIMU
MKSQHNVKLMINLCLLQENLTF